MSNLLRQSIWWFLIKWWSWIAKLIGFLESINTSSIHGFGKEWTSWIHLNFVFFFFFARQQNWYSVQKKKERTHYFDLTVNPANIRFNEDVLKIFVLKMSWSRRMCPSWPYVFKTSSRHFQDVLQRYLHAVFKAYHQVKLFLLTRLREVFNMFLRPSFPKTVIYRGIFQGCYLLLRNLWSVYKICNRDKNFSSFCFSLYYTISWLFTEGY